jgi:hypothetical protein
MFSPGHVSGPGHVAAPTQLFAPVPVPSNTSVEEWLSCHICDRKLASQSELGSHLEQHISFDAAPEGKKLSCQVCGKAVESQSELEHHLSEHSEGTNFVLYFCS